MSLDVVLAHLLLPAGVAAVAVLGAWRCWRLLRYGRDPRLLKLMWFYALFAASLASYAVWMGQAHSGTVNLSEVHSGNFSDIHGSFAGSERITVFLLAHHVLMLASLGVAVEAFGQKRKAAATVAAAGLAVFSSFIPVVLALEAALTLYLAVRVILNHVERRSPGALQVAAGFFLFFVGHLTFFLFHQPGAARTPVGDVLSLVGLVLLVQLLPRPSA